LPCLTPPSSAPKMSNSKLDRLTAEQAGVLDLIDRGYSVVVVGEAGVGKSFLISQIRAVIGQHRSAVRVVCPTGTAATLVGGQTYHSFFGIGLGNGDKHDLLEAVRKKKKNADVLRIPDLLIIFDEGF